MASTNIGWRSKISVILIVAISRIADVETSNSPAPPPSFHRLIPSTPDCKSTCSILVRNETSTDADDEENNSMVDCEFVKDTFECERRSAILAANRSMVDDDAAFEEDRTNRSCRMEQLRVGFAPYIFDHPMFHAALSLNISLNIFDSSTKAAAIRLICLESGGHEREYYCVNRTRPSHWDRFYWPCRLFDFSRAIDRYSSISSATSSIDGQPSSSSIVYPLQFHNECFRLSAFALFMINVTLYPQNCVSSFVFRMPSTTNVEATDASKWIPLTVVDTSPDDGIWISVSSPNALTNKFRIRRTKVEIWEILYDGGRDGTNTKSLRRDGFVSAPETSIFFKDLRCGNYYAVTYAEHSACDDDEERCGRIHVPFNLTKDHYTRYTKEKIDAETRLKKAWVPVVAAIGGVVVGFIVIGATVVAYLRWKAKRRKRVQSGITFVQFTKRPVVLILYTNDFAQHRRSVMELAAYLQTRANCDVELDEWALVSTSTGNGYRTPMEWLMHALQRADYFLIVFSAGAKETVFRPVDSSSTLVELRSERPWDETFAPAMHFVLQRILQTARSVDATNSSRDASNRNRAAAAFDRYVCVHFSYSPVDAVVPELFRTLPCPKLAVPDDLRSLICHLHEFPRDTVYENCPMDADRLSTSIADARAYIESNPGWLRSRLVERGGTDRATAELSERQRINDIATAIDRLRAPVNAALAAENLNQYYEDVREEHNRELMESGMLDGGGDTTRTFLLLPTEEEESAAAGSATESGGQFDLLPPDDDELTSLFLDSNKTGSTSNRNHVNT